VVEDDDNLRETITEVIADTGHDVRSARDGHEALDQLTSWEADVLVLDLMMPGMDAYDFRREQRTLGRAPAARVLVLSAVPDLPAAAERLDADAWVAKPFLLDDMLAAVERLADQRPPS
jgi:CheY-like chemotaxis protein